jgi:hypothetical protein
LGRIDPLEWVGGRISVRRYPELIVWCAGGVVLGAATLPAGLTGRVVVSSLIDTMRAPLSGGPRRPRRIRVASKSMASALRARFGARIEVVIEATPEIDALAADVVRWLGVLGEG